MQQASPPLSPPAPKQSSARTKRSQARSKQASKHTVDDEQAKEKKHVHMQTEAKATRRRSASKEMSLDLNASQRITEKHDNLLEGKP